ncbi:MAG TPA: HAD-IA family hydrolase [Methylophilaceae bacterium]|nr:HAD-IA family hydrolase [Methylophilaceae bacterium]
MPKRFDLIVFDWDGTLADSTQMIVECIRQASAEAGLSVPEPAAASNIIGLGLREAIAVLFGSLSDSQYELLTARYRHHYFARDQQTLLFEGAAQAIGELEQQGFMLAVATGKGRNGLNRSLADSGIAHHIHASRCADECLSKPHPQMLMEIMDELGVEAERTLMVGDTSYDLQMARNAKVASLAVSYGAHALEDLLQHEPLAHFDQFTKLNQWLIMNA